jgi:multisubunit Na+/H+ antiporter MnhC subunit
MITYAFLVSAFSLMLVGIFGLLTHRNIIRILLAVNILETGVNLLVVALGYVPGGEAPIITKAFSASTMAFVDPLPQALVLTSIVIGLGTTALALAITLRHYRGQKSLDLSEEIELPYGDMVDGGRQASGAPAPADDGVLQTAAAGRGRGGDR